MFDSAELIWQGKDEDGVSCEFDRVESKGSRQWQLSMVEGPFSGYPTINLTREDIAKLYEVIGEELKM